MNFSRGCQPCANYTPQMDRSGEATFANRHECYSPPGCDGAVSFCDACKTDHHSDGYQTCTGTWHTKHGPCAKCEAARG